MNIELVSKKERELLELEQRMLILKEEIEVLKQSKKQQSNFNMSPKDKIELFASLFKGRNDVFA